MNLNGITRMADIQTNQQQSPHENSQDNHHKGASAHGKVEHIHSMYVCSGHNSDSLMPAQVKFIRLSSSKNSKREAYIEVLDGKRGLAFTPPQYQPTRRQEQGHLGGSCLPAAPDSHHRRWRCGSSGLLTRPSRRQQRSPHLQ